MSGTSMATPHVAGAVALCLSGGACSGQSPAQVIQTMRTAAANKRASTPSYGFTGISGRYYGDMVWSGADLGSGGTPPTPDFSLSSSPTSRTITQGQSTTYAFTVNPTGGFNSQVSLSTSALPSGVSASFSPNPTTGSSTLTITTTAGAATGTTNITVTGVGGGLTRTVGSLVDGQRGRQPTPDFSLSSNPEQPDDHQGQSTTYALTVNRPAASTAGLALDERAAERCQRLVQPEPGDRQLDADTSRPRGRRHRHDQHHGHRRRGRADPDRPGLADGQRDPDGQRRTTRCRSPDVAVHPRGTADLHHHGEPGGRIQRAVSFSVSGLGFVMGRQLLADQLDHVDHSSG